MDDPIIGAFEPWGQPYDTHTPARDEKQDRIAVLEAFVRAYDDFVKACRGVSASPRELWTFLELLQKARQAVGKVGQ